MIWSFIAGLLKGPLSRVLDTVDRRIEAKNDRERIKAEIIKTHMETRAGWLKAGGVWTLMLFAIPAAAHYVAVTVYSILWCAGCAYPQDWTIAAMPYPMSQWQGWIVMASIGGLALLGRR